MRQRLKLKGLDGRIWHLVDWQVLYDNEQPSEKLPFDNYVPEDEDTNTFLERAYGPFGHPILKGRVFSRPRKKK